MAKRKGTRRVFWLLPVVLSVSGCAASKGAGVDPPVRAVTRTTVLSPAPAAALWTEPERGFRPVERVINHAQHTIFLAMYILTDTRIVGALERAAAQEVSVYVLLEPHPLGMGTQPQLMAAKLRAAGVFVRWSRPRFRLLHAKYLVADDRIAVISTANFSRTAFSHNREFLVVLRRRRDVREISNLFRRDWDGLPESPTDPSLVISPLDSRAVFAALIRRARRSLDIYGEELNDSQIVTDLMSGAHRGVHTRLLLPQLDASLARRLRHARVEARRLSNFYVHAKVIVVDGLVAFVGSENMSAASLDENRELGVILGRQQAKRLAHVFQSDWRHGRNLP